MAFKNKGEERAHKKAYRETHRDQERERSRKWYYANLDKDRERTRKWRADHPDQNREYNRKWSAAHPDKVVANRKAQHAKRRGNGGSYTAKQWLQLKKTYGRCVGCGLSEAAIIALGRTLAADHVLPIAKGGSSNIENIQPLCHGRGGCNNKKAARHIDYRRTA
jgi:hypothetical protein